MKFAMKFRFEYIKEEKANNQSQKREKKRETMV